MTKFDYSPITQNMIIRQPTGTVQLSQAEFQKMIQFVDSIKMDNLRKNNEKK